MEHIRRLLRSNTAKTSMATVLIIVLVIAGAYLVFTGKIDLSNLKLPFGISGTSDQGGVVDRKLQFSWVNQFTGAASASKTFYIYKGNVLMESLTTDSDGIKATARNYKSGEVLSIKYVDGNAKEWYSLTVPTMSANDAQSQTYNPVSAGSTFSIGTFTNATTSQGVAYVANYGITNGTTPTFRYEIMNTGADNTGVQDSAIPDAVYGNMYQVWVVVKISGTGYETVVMNGFDQTFTLGTAQYGVLKVDANALCKWKVGNNYAFGYSGDTAVTFGLDLTGLDGTSPAVVMNIRALAYVDPSFAQAHGGNFGSSLYQLCTHSCALVDDT